MLVDSHCHINFEALQTNLADILEHARVNGVSHMLCVAINLTDYPQVKQLADTYDHIFASVGVHPNEHPSVEPSIDELLTLADDPQVVAIGETGLDYFRSEGELEWQRERFRCHIRAARQCGKPLIVHMRDASDDTLRIMQEESANDVGGVMHCFTATGEVAKAALALGFYISFSGIVTFKNSGSLREVAAQVPSNRLLIETDSPYLAPVPYRGKTNQPAYVRHVAEQLAELRGIPFAELAEQTTQNFFSLFKDADRKFALNRIGC